MAKSTYFPTALAASYVRDKGSTRPTVLRERSVGARPTRIEVLRC